MTKMQHSREVASEGDSTIVAAGRWMPILVPKASSAGVDPGIVPHRQIHLTDYKGQKLPGMDRAGRQLAS